MNILWITNIMLPPICEAMGLPVPSVGGWMYASLKRLMAESICSIAVATVYLGSEIVEREIDGATYFLLPLKGKSPTRYCRHLEPIWRQVRNRVMPDIVHIHGSEYAHGLSYVKACGGKGVVVSLQGIVSGIARYYTSGIGLRDALMTLTFRDIVRWDSTLQQQVKFVKRGKREIKLLKGVDHVIGRTDWDRTHALALNPALNYHYCGETLRDVFYRHKWSYGSCEPHTVFVSQASYPIKGLHILLEAMPLGLRRFPDAKVYVAGSDETAKPWYRIAGYGKYLKKLIKKYNLQEKIIFTGMLKEEQMCQCYLRSNVFVCCSAIENSPNSLGEAQLLGMPHIASFVGGIPEIVNYNQEVLYRFEEYEMLAEKICTIFEKGSAADGADFDCSRYDGEGNTNKLITIYKEIR